MSRYRRSEDRDTKVYVGELGSSANKEEIEDAFRKYGPLKSVWVARHPPGFAFIEYEDARDAEDCVRGLDGRTVCGRRIRVELSTAGGRRRRDRRGRPPPRRGSRLYKPPDDKCYQCGERGHYARECKRYDRRGRSRKYLRSLSRTSSRSRSRSRSRGRRSRSKSATRSHSRNRSRSNDRRRSNSRGRSRSRSRSNDPKMNGGD